MALQTKIAPDLLQKWVAQPSSHFQVIITCDVPCHDLEQALREQGIQVVESMDDLQIINAKLCYQQLQALGDINGIDYIELDDMAHTL